jgi:hypothetical protein
MKTHTTSNLVAPYSVKELSAIYGVSKTVIRLWLRPLKEEIGPRLGHYYNVAQVTIIFEHLGKPSRVIGMLLMFFHAKLIIITAG